jgi:hypothetical protein
MRGRVFGLLLVAVLGIANVSHADLVFNGFEAITPVNPPSDPSTATYAAPDTFTDTAPTPDVVWTVADLDLGSGSNGVTIIQNSAVAHSGIQFLDLNGAGPGSIATDFSTIVGATYLLNFAYADNPFRSGGPDPVASVTVAGLGPNLVSTTVTHSTSVPGALDWTVTPAAAPFSFVADDTTTTLTFSTFPLTDTELGGILLDSISVTLTAIPEARAWLGLGLVGGVFGLGYAGRSLLSRRTAKAAV